MTNPSVLIIGSGPTGMTAAIEFKRAGLDVRIVDKSDHLARYSQALIVQARTLEQWQRYAIAAEAVQRGRQVTEAKFWSEGKQVLCFAFDRVPSRYPYALFLPQSETEAILNAHMESLGVKTERKVELMSLTQENGEAKATLRHPDGRTEELSPRWVIGCDGAHSTVRDKMAIPFEGGGVGLSFFLGDLELDGADAPDRELSIHLHHGDVVFMGRLSDKLVRLIVALHGEQNEGEDRKLNIEDFQRAVDHMGVRVNIRSSEWMTPFHVNDRQARNYRVGNVFLAGDASHIHSPVGGQGMNTGIQDVANLAWKVAAVVRGASDELLNSYEEERTAVGKALLRFTERGLKTATEPNRILDGIRDALLPFLSKLESVQRGTVGFISETSINYRSSSIVMDHGGDGDLRAGDRMPDVDLQASTLLSGWTSARHLAISFNGSPAQTEELRSALPHAEVLPLESVMLKEEGHRLLGKDQKLLIMRPDGYIGYRGPWTKREDWLSYARQDKLL